MRSNCPNCNGVLSYEGGLHCDYCGAWFERPRVDSATIRSWGGKETFYSADGIYHVSTSYIDAGYITTGTVTYGCSA